MTFSFSQQTLENSRHYLVLGVTRAQEHLSVVCLNYRCECTCLGNNTWLSDASHYATNRRKSRFWRTRRCVVQRWSISARSEHFLRQASNKWRVHFLPIRKIAIPLSDEFPLPAIFKMLRKFRVHVDLSRRDCCVSGSYYVQIWFIYFLLVKMFSSRENIAFIVLLIIAINNL